MCILFSFLIIIYLLNITRVQCSSGDGDGGCYHSGLNDYMCPPLNSTSRCKRVDATSVFCCHIHTEYELIEGIRSTVKPNDQITALRITNMSLFRLEVNLPEWKDLIMLSITDGNITQIMGSLESKDMRCLNISSNHISEIDPLFTSGLSNLVRIDVSNNNITLLPEIRKDLPSIQMDLSNNIYLNCSNILDLFATPLDVYFNKWNDTRCTVYKSKSGSFVLSEMGLDEIKVIAKILADCPRGDGWKCKCEYMMVPRDNIFHSSVDCSSLHLLELPRNLPQYTNFLNVSNNNITSLETVISDPSYQYLVYFYADNNNIESIDILEGSNLINKFVALSLRYNRLSAIPIYILNNVFSKNTGRDPEKFNLGFNKLKCDCNTAQDFKFWLLANKHHITDVNDLLCSNFKESVLNLDQSLVCVTPTNWTDYIYYIIASEILFLVLLVAKVSYDYWVFKTAGYLPWPASKMPKMPCDWLFES